MTCTLTSREHIKSHHHSLQRYNINVLFIMLHFCLSSSLQSLLVSCYSVMYACAILCCLSDQKLNHSLDENVDFVRVEICRIEQIISFKLAKILPYPPTSMCRKCHILVYKHLVYRRKSQFWSSDSLITFILAVM